MQSQHKKILEQLKQILDSKKRLLEKMKNARPALADADTVIKNFERLVADLELKVLEFERMAIARDNQNPDAKPALSWLDVLSIRSKTFGTIWQVPAVAKQLGFEFFLWNDRVYTTDGKDFKETNYLVTDVG